MLVSLYYERTALEGRKKITLQRSTKHLIFFQNFFVCLIYWHNRKVQIILFSFVNICKQFHILFLYQFKPQRTNPLVIFMAHPGHQPALLVSVLSPEQTVSALQLYACWPLPWPVNSSDLLFPEECTKTNLKIHLLLLITLIWQAVRALRPFVKGNDKSNEKACATLETHLFC